MLHEWKVDVRTQKREQSPRRDFSFALDVCGGGIIMWIPCFFFLGLKHFKPGKGILVLMNQMRRNEVITARVSL